MRGVEAFSIGEKRGKKYTPQDLEDIVRNFREFGKGQRPGFDVPVVRGHEETPEAQEKFLSDTSIPAGAWVEDAKTDGRKLYLDLRNVSPELEDDLLKGKYGAVSVELYDQPPEGIPGRGRMLRRLAVLGGEIPQDKNLKPPPMPTAHSERGLRVVGLRDVLPGQGFVTCFSEVAPMPKFLESNNNKKGQLKAIWTKNTKEGLDPDDFGEEDMKKYMADDGTTPDKEKMMQRLAEAGAGEEDMKSPDAMMAAMCRMADMLDGQEETNYDEDPTPPKDDEEKAAYAARAQKMAAYAEKLKKFGEDNPTSNKNKPAASAPVVNNGKVPEMDKLSETAMNRLIDLAASRIETRLLAKVDSVVKRVDTIDQNTAAVDIDRFCEHMRIAGKITAADLDPNNPFNLKQELLDLAALDAQGGPKVHRFSEKGKTTMLGHLEWKKKQIEAGRPVVRRGELSAVGKFSEELDAGKAKVGSTYDMYSEQLRKSGVTREAFLKGYEDGLKTGNIKSADEYLEGAKNVA